MNLINYAIQTKRSFWILILLMTLLAACSMFSKKKQDAKDTPPWSTVIKLYAQPWDNNQSAFFDRDETTRTFAPPLSTLIIAEANRNFTGKLNFDPLYHAKNPQIKNLNVARPIMMAMDHSTISVTFNNINEPVKIQVDAIMLQTGEWRIANIRYPDNTDLISILIN